MEKPAAAVVPAPGPPDCPAAAEEPVVDNRWRLQQFTDLLVPVAATLALAVGYTWALGLEPGGSQPMLGTLPAASDAGNAAALLGYVVALTLVFAALVVRRSRAGVDGGAALCFFATTTLFPGYAAWRALAALGVPTDWPAFAFVVANAGAVATALILMPEQFPRGNRCALVLSALGASWPFACLPELTCWLLLLLLVLWDVLAVLTPCGPLRYLAWLAQERVYMAAPFAFPPGLVYRGDLVELGLGDFIFYAVAVARATIRGWLPLAAVAVAELFGVIATIAYVQANALKMVPALPLVLCLAAFTYWTSVETAPGYVERVGGLGYVA